MRPRQKYIAEIPVTLQAIHSTAMIQSKTGGDLIVFRCVSICSIAIRCNILGLETTYGCAIQLAQPCLQEGYIQ
jgi:hypothetical protein